MVRTIPNINPNIVWYEGMMLTPQHFQQYDKYIATISEFMMASLGSNNWGLVDLKIDHASLANGEMRILDCKAVFNDGVFFDSLSSPSGNLLLNLNQYDDEFRDEPQIIVIRIPKEVSSDFTSEEKRFVSDNYTQDSDENIAHSTISIQRKTPNVELALAARSNDKYSQVEIAEVKFSGGIFEITSYHPPSLRVIEVFDLSKKLTSLAKQLREKAIFISDQAAASRGLKGNIEITRTELNLQSLCRGLPELENAIAIGSHPNEVYSILCRLSGGLTVLNDCSVPPSGGKYIHRDISNSIMPHFNYISEALLKINKNYKLTEMETTNLGFKIDLHEFEFGEQVIIVFEKNTPETTNMAINWFSECLISGSKNIEDLRKKRTLGVSRRILSGSDRERCVVGNNYEIMEINIESGLLGSKDIMEIRSSTSDDVRMPETLYIYSIVE